MKEIIGLRIVIAVIICLVTITGLGYGQESDKPYKGEIRFRYGYFGVDKDDGRFREDQWQTDNSTGGLDWLHLESIGPDENGYEWVFEGRALYDYDYRMSLLLKKEDSHYLKLDFSGLRRYFDGSNEYWDPTQFGLDTSFAEKSDGGFFTDRRNYNIEFGLTPLEGPEVILGWHRLERDGKEVLLRGSQAKGPLAGGKPRFRGIPAMTNMKGITDTFYAEVAQTFAEKYNFRIRQEFEQYRDEQLIVYPRYNNDGSVDQWRTLEDDPGYTNWRTMLMFDSFLDDQTYVTANYMYNYLNNNSSRNMIRPSVGGSTATTPFTNSKVGNSRRTNVGAFGYRKANFMKENLSLSAGLRVEDSKTSSQSIGLSSSGGGTLREAWSKLDEVRLAGMLRLVYKGIERTTLSFDADLEQRFLDWSESVDTRSMEINGEGAVDIFDRRADIDYTDQIYTFKAVRRHSRALKSTVKFRIKDLKRSYTDRFDNDLSFYPGYLGSYRRRGNDVTLKTDWRMNGTATSTLMYQFVQESIDTELGGKTQNLEIHRGLASLSFSPAQNMFLVGTFMLENYNLDTPGNGTAGTDNAASSKPFDYVGNSYSILLDGTYAFNENTSCTVGLQHTESMGEGDGDNANDSAYDKVGLMLKHKVAKNQTIGAGYQFINFNNHNGNSFDDYEAHGAIFTYTYTF